MGTVPNTAGEENGKHGERVVSGCRSPCHRHMPMETIDNQPPPQDEDQRRSSIPDPMPVAEARDLLGVSPGKMSQLLKGTLPWRPSELDGRVKLVSRAAVERLLTERPAKPTSSPRPAQKSRSAREPRTARTMYLAEWMAARGVSPQDLVRRSQQIIGQQQVPSSPFPSRETLLRAKPLSLPTIRRIARKAQQPLPVTAERLAEALGVSVEELRRPPSPPEQ